MTTVKVKGQWLPLAITVDATSGLPLSVHALSAQDIKALKEWIEPIAQSVGAQVLVTDDADGAEDGGLMRWQCSIRSVRPMSSATPRS